MKKIIAYIIAAALVVAFALAVLTPVGYAAGGLDKAELKARQNEVHAAAETLRSLGITDDSEAIQALKAEWERCNVLLNATPMGTYKITGYDPYCVHCCGKSDGITASGVPAIVGYTVAMKGVPFGTKIYIDGLGIYEVQDRGVGNGVIDVTCNGHAECYSITGRYDVWLIG